MSITFNPSKLSVMTEHPPTLYSFLRCPYAMRARMALHVAGIACHMIEVRLKNKPPEMLALSPKGTVPVLHLPDGRVIDESLDIMHYALSQHDPEHWLPTPAEQAECAALIEQNDKQFKWHLDRYKYPTRYEAVNSQEHRALGEAILSDLEMRLTDTSFILAGRLTMADIALFPFIRQWAGVQADALHGFPKLAAWLHARTESELFKAVMQKVSAARPS